MAKTHLRYGSANHTACGRTLLYSWDTTNDANAVDCAKCRKSGAFDAALAAAATFAVASNENARIQRVLDILAEAVWEEARDRNYCSTFDEIAEIGSSALPAGLHFRKPRKTFVLTLEVDAASEDDAQEIVNDNGVEDYLVSATPKS